MSPHGWILSACLGVACVVAITWALPETPFPLQVGDVWDYEGVDGRTLRRTVDRDVLAGGAAYVGLVDTTWDRGGAVVGVARSAVRFDGATGRVLERRHGNERAAAALAPCPLTVHAEAICTGGEVWRVSVAERPLEIAGGDTFTMRSYASTEGFGVFVVAEGVGPVVMADDDGVLVLRHARVGGRQIGAPPRPLPQGPGPAFHVWPNPTRGAITVELDAPGPEALTAEVFDVLGRRVRGARLPAGGYRVALDVAVGLAAGTYVLRVRGPGGVVGGALFVKE